MAKRMPTVGCMGATRVERGVRTAAQTFRRQPAQRQEQHPAVVRVRRRMAQQAMGIAMAQTPVASPRRDCPKQSSLGPGYSTAPHSPGAQGCPAHVRAHTPSRDRTLSSCMPWFECMLENPGIPCGGQA